MIDNEAFSKLAGDCNLISLGTVLHWDHETPISLADRFVDQERFFLLESATSGPGNVARYSFMGFDPLWFWQLRDDTVSLCIEGCLVQTKLAGQQPIQLMYRQFRELTLGSMFAPPQQIKAHDLSHMAGAVGFISFDVATRIEPSVGPAPKKTLGLPDMDFQIPRNFLVLDHLARKLHVYRFVYLDTAKKAVLADVFAHEDAAWKKLLLELKAMRMPPALKTRDTAVDLAAMTSTMDWPTFKKAGAVCLDYIQQGEAFQIQISNRLTMKTDARPFDIFRHLRMINPSPYMFFYKFQNHHILGASPEMMVSVEEGRITHRPIAGTRRRTWIRTADARMRQELVESEKERAEHVMLVDLSRNDIGRLADPGTVSVDELMVVEEYSHVFHMVSQVSGQLKKDFDPAVAMAFSFPNGTVSGAPKIRAIQAIYELETVSREFYAGSLGVFDFGGNLKSTLLIRTIYCADGVAATQAAAGFVFDSIVEQEWQETQNKMAACVSAIQNTLGPVKK
jgi:anthranilate synthase component 1